MIITIGPRPGPAFQQISLSNKESQQLLTEFATVVMMRIRRMNLVALFIALPLFLFPVASARQCRSGGSLSFQDQYGQGFSGAGSYNPYSSYYGQYNQYPYNQYPYNSFNQQPYVVGQTGGGVGGVGGVGANGYNFYTFPESTCYSNYPCIKVDGITGGYGTARMCLESSPVNSNRRLFDINVCQNQYNRCVQQTSSTGFQYRLCCCDDQEYCNGSSGVKFNVVIFSAALASVLLAYFTV